MLLRVAGIQIQTRHLELPPQPPIPDHGERVLPGQDKKLRPDTKLLETDLREHNPLSARVVPVRERRLFIEDLDEALAGLGEEGRKRFVRGSEEGFVDEGEGVERDARLGNEGEVGVIGVFEEGGREEAALGGDESGGGAFGGATGDVAADEDAGEDGGGGFGVEVDVDVEERGFGRGGGEESVPERSEGKGGVCEEEEGDLGLGFGPGTGPVVGSGGAAEEGEVFELVGGGDLESLALRREDSGG